MTKRLMNKIDIKKNVINIYKYLRISNGLSLDQMGAISSTSRYRAARIEKGFVDIDIYEWTALTRHFNIDISSHHHKNISYNSSNDIDAFNIKAPYSSDLFSGGQVLNMHIEAFKALHGEQAFLHFCEKEKI